MTDVLTIDDRVCEFVKFYCARRCDKCKAGNPPVINSAGYYSHQAEGNHCNNHPIYKAYEEFRRKR